MRFSIAICLAVLLGCGPKAKPADEPTEEPTEEPARKTVHVEDYQVEAPTVVGFEVDSAELSEDARTALDGLADVLVSTPKITKVEVWGHADPSEDVEVIALARAEAVIAYLVDHGVDAGRLVARSFEEDEPDRSVTFLVVDRAAD